MRFELVQGDNKPLERRIKHDGLGDLAGNDNLTGTLTVEGVAQFTATVTVAGNDCATFIADVDLPATTAPGVYGAQWTLTAPDFSCTLPCEPDCLIVCERITP